MSFLTPLFLLGATAIALPILFHLIRRSAKEKLAFSSLMFLSPSPPRVTKRSRLEHLLLLLARCLILVLLSAAFARPFLRKPVPVTPSEGPTRRVVILVDTSASMRRGELWASAKKKVENHLRTIPRGDNVAVLTFDSETRQLAGWEESSTLGPGERAATVLARLNAIEPGWRATELGRAIVRASEVLVEGSNKDLQQQQPPRGEIIVVSDLQAGARLEALQGYEWPKQVSVTLDTLKTEERSNVSLQVLGQGMKRIGGTNATLRLRVQNNPGARKEQFEIAWASNGQVDSPKQNVYIPAGQARVVAAPALPAGSSATELIISGDSEPFDNRTYYISGERKTASVVFFGKDNEADPQGLLYYLKRGMETSSGGAVRVITSADAARDTSSMAIISGTVSAEELAFARELLANGKTILLTARDNSAVETLKQLTENPAITSREAEVGNYALFGAVDFNHPLFSPFADAKFSDFTKINFWKYRQLDLGGVTNAIIAAKFDSGSPAVIEIPSGKGRIYFLATSWAPTDSQLALSSKFMPLLFIMLEQGGELYATTPQYLVGQPVPLPAERGELTGPAKIALDPDQTTFVPTEPGVYSLNGKPAFAVNLDPAESRIAPLPVDQLQALGMPLQAPETAITSAKVKLQQQQLLDTEVESRQKFWRFLVLAAIGFVLLETILAARASARLSPVAT